MVTCTRWAEIVDSMSFHAQLCHTFGCPGEFRLLNRADGTFLIGQGENSEIEYKRFLEVIFCFLVSLYTLMSMFGSFRLLKNLLVAKLLFARKLILW